MRFAIALLVLVAAAFADGGMVAPPDMAIQEFGQVAIIRYQDSVEQLSVASSFRSEATDFAWILPLPAEPVVDSFSLGLLDELQYYCRPIYRSGSGIGCTGDAMSGPGRYSDSLGVEQVVQGVIGPYAYEVLRTAEPDTLAAYLRDHGYALPDSAAAVFRHYTDMYWEYFVVARLNDSAEYEYDRSVGIRLTFAADSAVYPLYISRLSSGYSGVVLYVVADHRQMFNGATLLFSGRIDRTTFPAFPDFLSRSGHLTKLMKYYDVAEMEDIWLRRAPDDREFRVIESGSGWLYGSLGSLVPLLGIVIFARRRRRRR